MVDVPIPEITIAYVILILVLNIFWFACCFSCYCTSCCLGKSSLLLCCCCDCCFCFSRCDGEQKCCRCKWCYDPVIEHKAVYKASNFRHVETRIPWRKNHLTKTRNANNVGKNNETMAFDPSSYTINPLYRAAISPSTPSKYKTRRSCYV